MENRVYFAVEGEAGTFVYPDARFKTVLTTFHELLEDYQSGFVTSDVYISVLNKLVKDEPDFIDGYAHLSAAYDELSNNPKKALKAALAGLAIGNRFIPEGFSGRIEWAALDNRPFLRALHSAALSYAQLGRHRDSGLLMEKLLAYNPDDNQGVRFLVGSELMRGGEIARAGEIFAKNAEHYPPYYYEQALFHLINQNWVEAATTLRKGFATNDYIAEMFSGTALPQPHFIWHGSSLACPDAALAYMGTYHHLWFLVPERVSFVRWLFNHSSILHERAEIAACKEALITEGEPERRNELLERLKTLLSHIDDGLSAEIIRKAHIQRPDAEYLWMNKP